MNDEISFYKYRDSLSGLRNEQFAIKKFNECRRKKKFGAVMVKLEDCENMPFEDAQLHIYELAELLARIVRCDVARVKNGEFVFFGENYEEEAKRTEFFIRQFSCKEAMYTVGKKSFRSRCDNYYTFMEKLRKVTFLKRLELDEKGIC